MPLHPLEQKISQVLRRQYRYQILRDLGLLLTLTLTTLVGAGFLDYLVRIEETGARALLSLLVAGLLVWGLRRHLPTLWQRPTNLLPLAGQIEARYPALKQQLVSALEFLHVSTADHRGGSGELRTRVIEQTTALAQPLDFSALLDARPSQRVGVLALLTTVITIAISITNPSLATLALARITNPWRDTPWPKSHDLQIDTVPHRIARNAAFEVVVQDRSRAPLDSVQIHYRYETSDGEREETNEMTARDTTWVHRRERVTQSFSFRVTGGDDANGSWHFVEVVDPPRIEQMTLIAQPPDYTHWPATPASSPLRLLAGTVLEMKASVSAPIDTAWIRSIDDFSTQESTEDPTTWSVLIADGGVRLSLPATGSNPWQPRKSGIHLLMVRDPLGLEAELCRWMIQIIPDAPPVLSWIHPSGDSRIRLSGSLSLHGAVKDDVGIESAELQYRTSGETPGEWNTQPIKVTSNAPRRSASERDLEVTARRPVPDGIAAMMYSGDAGEWNERWSPGDVASISSPMKLELRVLATDTSGLTATTDSRFVTIVSDEELREHWKQRFESVLVLLQEALQFQRVAQQQTLDHLAQLPTKKALSNPDSSQPDPAKLIWLQQQRVQQILSPEPGGVLDLIAQVRDEMTANRWEDAQQQDLLTALDTDCRKLSTGPIAALAELLPRAIKQTEDSARQSFMQINGHQQEITTVLEKLLARQKSWTNLQNWQTELNEIRTQQSDLWERTTAELVESEAGTSTLTNEQRATISRLAGQQAELARRYQVLSQQASSLSEAKAPAPDHASQDQPSQELAQMLQRVTEAPTAGLLQDARRALQRHQLGEAIEQQQQAIQSLDELINQLSGRPNSTANMSSPESLAEHAARAAWLIAVDRLLERQELVNVELRRRTGRLDENKIPTETPVFIPSQEEDTLPQTERDIANLSQQFLVELPPLKTFQFVLRLAVSDLRTASKLISQQNWEPAISSAELATQRLQQLRAAIEERQPDQSKEPAAKPTHPPAKSQGTPPKNPHKQSRSELLLIRDLQSDLRNRTGRIEADRSSDGQLRPNDSRELERVAREQGQLAELVWQLSEEGAGSFESQSREPTVPDSKEAGSDTPREKKPDALSSADEEGEDIGEESPRVRFLRMARQMTQVGERLSREDTSAATQALQDRILGELEGMIGSAGSSSGQSAAQQTPGQLEDKSAATNQPSSDKPKSTGEGSESGNDTGTTGAAAARQYTKDIWGELPLQTREQLLNALPEKFLPMYETMIEQYYRRLSRKKTK